MLVLQAAGDIRKVALWLGHDDIQTTEVYLRADPTEKLEAIDAMVPPTLKRGEFRMPDKLMALLRIFLDSADEQKLTILIFPPV